MTTPTLDEQIREVGREIGLRKNVYPRFIANKKLTQTEADRHIECMEAAYQTLKALRLEREAKANETPPTATLRDEYPDKHAGLKADAIRTQGDTK